MAKVILERDKRKSLDVGAYILGKMKQKGITMDQMAAYIGITRQTLQKRLFNGSIQLRDFWFMADKLDLTDEERLAFSKLY